jgi:hypothetical protein
VGCAAAMAVPGTNAAQIPMQIAVAIAGTRRLPMH